MLEGSKLRIEKTHAISKLTIVPSCSIYIYTYIYIWYKPLAPFIFGTSFCGRPATRGMVARSILLVDTMKVLSNHQETWAKFKRPSGKSTRCSFSTWDSRFSFRVASSSGRKNGGLLCLSEGVWSRVGPVV